MNRHIPLQAMKRCFAPRFSRRCSRTLVVLFYLAAFAVFAATVYRRTQALSGGRSRLGIGVKAVRGLAEDASCLLSAALWPNRDWRATLARPNFTFPDGSAARRHRKLVDVFDLSGYVIPNGDLCRNLTLVVTVLTAPRNLRERNAVRATWGGMLERATNGTGKVIFYIGKTGPDEQKLINREAEMFGDVVQGSLLDGSRTSLIGKEYGMVKWITDFCSKDTLKYALKMDDDLYLNVPNLLAYLESGRVKPGTINGQSTAGLCHQELTPDSPPDAYPYAMIPPYIGVAYLYDWEAARQLTDAGRKSFFWDLTSDIFVSGVIAAQTRNVSIVMYPWMILYFTELALEKLPEAAFAAGFKSAVVLAHSPYYVYDERTHLTPDMLRTIHRIFHGTS